MSVSFSVIGKQNKENGALWEKMIEESLTTLYGDVCICEKTPEPFHILGREKNIVKGYYEKKGQPDFKGVLAGGQCLCFEAKCTITDRINQNCVTDLQWKTLDQYDNLGALCFVMVCFSFEEYCRVPWKDWKEMKKIFGHKYIGRKECSQYKIKTKGHYVCFLDGVEVFDKSVTAHS